ncbi:DUF3141 domain-containing protein [Sinorhizobium meliloti]|nr:DUF3141 domain-containing protein [Sinorhizobium meliloti]
MPGSVLSCFSTVMRQRGEQYREYSAQTAPHVLNYGAELVVDGRTLDRPVHCSLARIIPPGGVAEATLRRRRTARQPRKPCVIGNCQAGRALMSLSSLRPELFCPFVVRPNE